MIVGGMAPECKGRVQKTGEGNAWTLAGRGPGKPMDSLAAMGYA